MIDSADHYWVEFDQFVKNNMTFTTVLAAVSHEYQKLTNS